MALFEVWLERSNDMKYLACFECVSQEKGKSKFVSAPVDSPFAAISIIRQEIRKVMGANDQLRIRNRIKIYDNYSLNDALEDLGRS
jgi:hypothetical protein